ncbi:DNA-directed RNA polymerase subunit alpha [Prevotella bivia]|uniref:DNA-directed RNA polymerase subunit alpha n=1 Tax=Prevotella bivia TaxID=28125 RepID=UPI00254FAF61|nr:DNA-directed RNA polymerase subunit alpha [Prevotella bivia]MDK7762690.1 DNA-directed RNA polymerase subunit alpha [Prevotella bivia]
MTNGKIKVTADTLYKFLVEHDFTISRLSGYMGVSNSSLMGSFCHDLDRLGRPRKFSAGHIKKLNDAIVRVAEDMRGRVLVFGSDKVFTNQRGATYDPGLLKPINQGIGKFFKVRRMTERVLGWNLGKWANTLSAPSSKIYGNITRGDADRLNAELLSVAGVLSSHEVVADDALEGVVNEIVASAVENSVTDDESKQNDIRTAVQSAGMTIGDFERMGKEIARLNSEPTPPLCTLEYLYSTFGDDNQQLASRLCVALEKEGISTLYELMTLSPWQLLDMEGVTGVTLELIHKGLKQMGVMK